MTDRFNGAVNMLIGKAEISGNLVIPADAKAIIIFSHGSGSNRFSSRNQKVAGYLQERNFGTLLFDSLTKEEDLDYFKRFDINLLTQRLTGAAEWLAGFPAANNCRIGFFGASTGAASALRTAAEKNNVFAVVSRGGRPDLVLDYLDKVTAPVLLIVGGWDYDIITLNRKALLRLTGEKKLEVIERASHLFEEKGAMEKVCKLAADWFEKYLVDSAGKKIHTREAGIH